jgi:hypothetical protein
MKKLLVILSAVSLFLMGCAGSGPKDEGEALDNALVSFTSSVQSSRWQDALAYVTPDEARQIGTSDGYEFLPEYQTAASRLPLSTLRKAGLGVDSDGRLVGIKAVMDETNERYKVSEEQAKVGTNLKQMEDDRIKRRIEEGQKILQEEEATAHQEPQVEVLTNRLTDDEKRKYGSTGELLAPESTREDGTSAESYNGDYK